MRNAPGNSQFKLTANVPGLKPETTRTKEKQGKYILAFSHFSEQTGKLGEESKLSKQ
jgi:hypothetical protein